MTKRDKVTIFSAALLAVLVIIAAVIAYAGPNAGGKADTASLILCCCIVAASILSVVIVCLTKIRRGKYEKRLNTGYYQRYEIIRDAVAGSQLSIATKSEIRNDVLDMLISALESGKPAESVVGNPEAFAKDIVRSYSKPSYMVVLGLIDAVITFAAIVLGVYVLLWLEQTESSFFSINIDNSMVFFFVMIAFIIMPVTKRLASTRSIWAYCIPIAFGVAFVLAAESLRSWFYYAEWVRVILDGTVRLIPNPWVFAAFALSVPLLLLLKHSLRKNMFRLKNK